MFLYDLKSDGTIILSFELFVNLTLYISLSALGPMIIKHVS